MLPHSPQAVANRFLDLADQTQNSSLSPTHYPGCKNLSPTRFFEDAADKLKIVILDAQGAMYTQNACSGTRLEIENRDV